MQAESTELKPLPADALTALQQGNKIEAIRRLRLAQHLPLKAAKEVVDDYLRGDPVLQRKYQQQAERTRRALWWIVAGAIVIAGYGWWRG